MNAVTTGALGWFKEWLMAIREVCSLSNTRWKVFQLIKVRCVMERARNQSQGDEIEKGRAVNK